MYDSDPDAERVMANLKKNALNERLGIKPEPIDYNRGRINTTPKQEKNQRDMRTFESTGKKVTSAKKNYNLNDKKFLRLIGYALLIAGLTAAVLASRSDRKIDPKTGFELYSTTETNHVPGK